MVGKIILKDIERNYTSTDWYELEGGKESWKGSQLKLRILSE